MKKVYLRPSTVVVRVRMATRLMNASGNLSNMGRGNTNIFGGGTGDDDWDTSAKVENSSTNLWDD